MALDLGASLHVTPHRDWFTRYEEIVGLVTFGDSSYAYDVSGIGDIEMVLGNRKRFML